jgi:hypothetical protein
VRSRHHSGHESRGVVAPTQYGNALASVYIRFAFESFLIPTPNILLRLKHVITTFSRPRSGFRRRSRRDQRPRDPDEASTKPEDTDGSWPNFWEKSDCLPHKDGKSIIIWETDDDSDYPNPRVRAGWPLIRLRQAYELLGSDHPRIVRYVETSIPIPTLLLTKVAISDLFTQSTVKALSSKDRLQVHIGAWSP